MGSKTTKWAQCHIWADTTFGIHSTQRAESMNSSVSQFCKKTSLATDLIKDLDTMSDNQHLVSYIAKVHSKLGNAILGAQYRTSVSNWVSSFSNFARKIMLSQFSLYGLYNCTKVSTEEDMYEITFSHNDSITMDYTKEEFKDKLELEDFGVIETKQKRMTSLKWCSCQFPTNYGLPCRHMCRVLFSLFSANRPDKDLLDQIKIDSLWKNIDDYKVKTYLETCRKGIFTFNVHNVDNTMELNQEERKLDLQATASIAVSLASQRDGWSKSFKMILHNEIVKMTNPKDEDNATLRTHNVVLRTKKLPIKKPNLLFQDIDIHVCNPDKKARKGNHQKRKEPSNPYFPTSKGHGKAGKTHAQGRKKLVAEKRKTLLGIKK